MITEEEMHKAKVKSQSSPHTQYCPEVLGTKMFGFVNLQPNNESKHPATVIKNWIQRQEKQGVLQQMPCFFKFSKMFGTTYFPATLKNCVHL